VAVIGNLAFSECSDLTSVTVLNPTPPRASNPIEASRRPDIALFVPEGAVGAYNSTTFWGDFGTIKAIGETGGEENTWTLEGGLTATLVGGTLTISGTGPMKDYPPRGYNAMPYGSRKGDITQVIIADGVTSIGEHAFSGCFKLSSVTIPNSVTYIGVNAFRTCSTLTSVTIPGSVDSIAYAAFHGTGLTSIIIPSSVAVIGNLAFGECSDLTSVTVLNPTPPRASIPIEASRRPDITLFVPEGAVEAYNSAAGWEGFKEILAIDQEVSVAYRAAARAGSSMPQISVRGRTLTVTGFQSSAAPTHLRLLDLRGRTVSSFNTAKNNAGAFSLSKVPAGRYIVEVSRSGVRLGAVGVMVR
jgi:hypothetical protein